MGAASFHAFDFAGFEVASVMMKMRVGFTFLALLAAFCFDSAIQAQTSEGQVLRVMSFNIRYNEPRDGVNAWPNRKEKVADVIRFHKADTVGVQEALLSQLKDLETLLPDLAWCGVGRTDGKEAGEYSAIIYRKSRLQLIQTGTFWLSEMPDKVGSMGWDAAYPRIVTWARFRDRKTKKVFIHFNTHFDHRGEKARTESATLIIKKLGELAGKLPFVLTGDLNVREEAAAYKTLREGSETVKIADAKYVTANRHFGGNSTFSAFKDLEPNNKIDYIFVRLGMKVLEHGILSDRWDGLWASDHLPVLAEIQIR